MKIFELLLCTGSFAHAREKDYKTFYTVQPLRALFGPKTPHFPESNWIERNNQAWIDRNDEAKEKVNAYSTTSICINYFSTSSGINSGDSGPVRTRTPGLC